MCTSGRAHERAELERDLGTETGRALLRKLQRAEPEADPFSTWCTLATFMQLSPSDDPRRDAILRAILVSMHQDHQPLWSNVLLLLFWPALLALFGKRRSWDREPDDLWGIIVATFLEATHSLDIQERPERIAKKLVNDTYSYVNRVYQRRWRWHDSHVAEGDTLIDFVVGDPDIDLTAIELREGQEREVGRYRRAFETGVIGEEDFHLLVATCVYSHSVTEYARERESSYQAWKKRRQRALKAVGIWEQGT